jgi:hypothetical protein
MVKVLQMAVVGMSKGWPTHLCLSRREKVTLDVEMLPRVTIITDLAGPTILRPSWPRASAQVLISVFACVTSAVLEEENPRV